MALKPETARIALLALHYEHRDSGAFALEPTLRLNVDRERKPMKRITITRNDNGDVEFETVTVDSTETVFFLNLDPQSEHWPSISANPVGAAPSDPSSQCFPEPTYGCLISGHGDEQGIIII